MSPVIAGIGGVFVVWGLLWAMADKRANGAFAVLVIGMVLLAAGGFK